MSEQDSFLKFARDRHDIALRRSLGIPRNLWTSDPILKKYRFTNVFRELDRTTIWFRENIRDPLKNDPRVMLATVAFRWFNRVTTGQVLFGGFEGSDTFSTNLFKDWNSECAHNRLRDVKPPWVTGAYIIKTPDGKDKLDGVLWCIDQFDKFEPCLPGSKSPIGWRKLARNLIEYQHSDMRLETMHTWLMEFPFIGHFMAYEIVTDLRWTGILNKAPDINTWANPGPGARRGLNRIHGRPLRKMYPVVQCVSEMSDLLPEMRNAFKGIAIPHQIEMREVEHTLCEFDKYRRAVLGEGRPRGVYR